MSDGSRIEEQKRDEKYRGSKEFSNESFVREIRSQTWRKSDMEKEKGYDMSAA